MKVRNLKSLLQNKQKIISREKGYPSQKSGRDGDFQVRRISGQGVFLFYKWNNKWYSARLTQYRPKTAEHKQKVKIPLGVSPSTIGELSLDSTGNLAVKKDKHKLNHIISADKDGLADSKQLRFVRSTTTGSVGSSMGDADAGEPEFLFQNTIGHAHLRLYSQSNVYDQFISFGRRHPDTLATSVWCFGLDSSANEFRLMYDNVSPPGDGSEATHGQIANVTPSSSSGEMLSMDYIGNLTVKAGMYLGAALRIEPTSGDYFNMHVANSTGVTTLSTVSDGGSTIANLILDIDGDIELNADGGDITFKDNTTDLAAMGTNGITSHAGSIYMKELADASPIYVHYGQLWVHDDTPNNLYFTDDLGNDILLSRPLNTAVWGCGLPRTTGQDGKWLGIPTGHQGAFVSFGTDIAAPDTSYAPLTTADDLGVVIWQAYASIEVTGCRIWYAQGGGTNTRHSVCLMRYDISADGDLSNGVEVAGVDDDSGSDDYTTLANTNLTMTSDVEVTGLQVLIAMVYLKDAANAAMTAKCILQYKESII